MSPPNFHRLGLAADVFLIDHSNELVYVADDGSVEFRGPSRAYGYEAKASVAVTRHVSLNGGLTKVSNAFYRGGDHRVYVDSAPHFVANAALLPGRLNILTLRVSGRRAPRVPIPGEYGNAVQLHRSETTLPLTSSRGWFR